MVRAKYQTTAKVTDKGNQTGCKYQPRRICNEPSTVQPTPTPQTNGTKQQQKDHQDRRGILVPFDLVVKRIREAHRIVGDVSRNDANYGGRNGEHDRRHIAESE